MSARAALVLVSALVLALMASSRLPVPVEMSISPLMPPEPPPPPETLPPPDTPELFLEPPSLLTMAAMAMPSATAAPATMTPIGMPKTVAFRAAEMAVIMPSKAAPMLPIMPATPA